MDLSAALRRLESLGTAQNRKVYARHGVEGPAYGVSYANLGKLRKQIGTDPVLARALWKSGNHDARVLATTVADAEAIERKTLEAWAKQLPNYVVTDAFSVLAAASPHARACARGWVASKDEWTSTAGWNVVARNAEDGQTFEPGELAELLERIEARIHASPNRTRHAMNGALIAIGLVSPGLERRALSAARAIGTVEVDHGETGCKTPDAAAYIAKTLERRRSRGSKPPPPGSRRRGEPPSGPRAPPARHRARRADSVRKARPGGEVVLHLGTTS